MENFSDKQKLMRMPLKDVSYAPCKANPRLVQLIKKKGRNIAPIMVIEGADEQVEAISGHDIVQAAHDAGLNFVWVIIIEDDDQDQLLLEIN